MGRTPQTFTLLIVNKSIHAFTLFISLLQLLGSLISDFVDSFRPTARINSICGEFKNTVVMRPALVPLYLIHTLTHTHTTMSVSEVCVLFLGVCIRSL